MSSSSTSFVFSSLLSLWSSGALSTTVFSVKQEWGACTGQQASPQSISPCDKSIITVATVKSSSIVVGTIGGVLTDMMLDSGSAVSLIHQDTLSQLKGTFTNLKIPTLHLVTASGDPLLLRHICYCQ